MSWSAAWKMGVAGMLAISIFLGCRSQPEDIAPSPEFSDRTTLNPGQPFGDSAELELAGTKMRVQVKREVQGNLVRYSLNSQGAVIAQEVYQDLPDHFGLVEAGEERYTAPLPLLKFPMSPGDSWAWKGTIRSGNLVKQATATISTSRDTLHFFDVRYETVRSDVVLTIDDHGDAPATALKLSFWFSENKGLLQREFGTLSSRTLVTTP